MIDHDEMEARRAELEKMKAAVRERVEDQAAIVDSHVPSPGPRPIQIPGDDDEG